MLKELEQPTETDAGTVLDQIERVVRWSDEFRLAFIKCNHPVQRETIRHLLLERLGDKRVLAVFLDRPIVSLLDELTARWDATRPLDAVCVYGLENSLNEQYEASPVLGRLNHDRDLIRRAIPAALLIWLPDFALDYVVRGAPDFWAWRSGVYEFPTDKELWRTDSIAALGRNAISLFSLPLEDKQKEIARLEELLRTAQTLPQQDERVQRTNARLLYQLGLLYQSLGRWDEALASYQQSLEMAEAVGDQANVAGLLHQIGTIHQSRGEYAAALARYEQSLKIFEALGDQSSVASSLHQIGSIYLLRGEYAAALDKYEQSLKIKEVLGNQAGVATSLHQIGIIHELRGEYAAALDKYGQSLKIAEALGNQAGVAASLGEIGNLHRRRGDYGAALVTYEQSLKINEMLGDRNGVARSLYQIGMIHQLCGEYAAALAKYEQSLKIAERLGDHASMANSHGQIGQLFTQTGRYAEAFEHLLFTLNTFKKLESPNAEVAVNTLKELCVHWGNKEFDAAWREARGEAVPDWLK